MLGKLRLVSQYLFVLYVSPWVFYTRKHFSFVSIQKFGRGSVSERSVIPGKKKVHLYPRLIRIQAASRYKSRVCSPPRMPLAASTSNFTHFGMSYWPPRTEEQGTMAICFVKGTYKEGASDERRKRVSTNHRPWKGPKNGKVFSMKDFLFLISYFFNGRADCRYSKLFLYMFSCKFQSWQELHRYQVKYCAPKSV